MKRFFLASCRMIGFLALGWMLACQDSGARTSPSEETLDSQEFWQDTVPGIARDKIAICVWPVVGLRREPGRKAYASDRQSNYLIPVYYGERVELLGVFDTVKAEKRVYMKIRLQDGQQGWVYEDLFEKYGRLAVVTSSAELYRRPDLMTLREEKLIPGEIIVVLEVREGWLHISGSKKLKKGWIRKPESLSFRQEDLKTALLFFKARQYRNPNLERAKLQEILNQQELGSSVLIDMVKERLSELGPSQGATSQDSTEPEPVLDEDSDLPQPQ